MKLRSCEWSVIETVVMVPRDQSLLAELLLEPTPQFLYSVILLYN